MLPLVDGDCPEINFIECRMRILMDFVFKIFEVGFFICKIIYSGKIVCKLVFEQ